MLRTLLTPRWLGYTLLAAVAVAVCLAAAAWQYQRTQDQLAVERAAVAQEGDYSDVVTGAQTAELPLEVLGRAVRLTATPVAGARSFVRSRLGPEGQEGLLVVDGMRLPDGRVVAVLQGWVPQRDSAPALPRGPVTVTGRLQPDENFYGDAPIGVGRDLVTITRAGLTVQWAASTAGIAAELAPGYVTAASPASGFAASPPVFGADPDVPFPLQNAFYSIQWLIFAGLVVFVWLRGLLEQGSPRSRGSGG
jgi:cytochrome oxidase assembly protein ShyY1